MPRFDSTRPSRRKAARPLLATDELRADSYAEPDRLPPIPETEQSVAQREAAAELIAGPRGALDGPFIAMLRSPELLGFCQRLGAYLRFRSVVPHKLRELAILVTASQWHQTYEWHMHAPIAQQAGLSPQLINALAQECEPSESTPAEQLVFQFCRELHQHHAVSDSLYLQAKTLLGEDGVVELCALCGYYTLLAMVCNVARTPLPTGATVPFSPA